MTKQRIAYSPWAPLYFALTFLPFLSACGGGSKSVASLSNPPSGSGLTCSDIPFIKPTALQSTLEGGSFLDLLENSRDMAVNHAKGSLRVLGSLGKTGTQGLHYILNADDGAKYSLHFGQNPPEHPSGTRVEVSGVKLSPASASGAQALAQLAEASSVCADSGSGRCFADPVGVSSGSAGINKLSDPAVVSTTGAQATAVFLIRFQNSSASLSTHHAQDVVFNQVSDYFRESSYGATWLTGNVLGPYTIPLQNTNCDPDQIATAAQAAARSAGVNLAQYQHFVYAFPNNTGCNGWIGLGSIGGAPSEAWINGALDLHTVSHEMGHNLGLYHANGLTCTVGSIAGACHNVEYADPSSSMGNYEPAPYTSYQKEQLAWLGSATPSKVTQVLVDGDYTLSPYEAADAGTKALKIMRATDPSTGLKNYYYLEYRYPIGYDNINTFYGFPMVMVHLGSQASLNSSYLINTHPEGSDWYNSGLSPGDSYTDQAAGVSVKWVSGDETQAVVHITVGDGKGAASSCGA